MNTDLLFKLPSAWLPMAMTTVVLLGGFLDGVLHDFVRQADEGIGAHLFQILIPLELPVIAYFAWKWLPRAPKQALPILMLQIIALFVPFAFVFFLKL